MLRRKFGLAIFSASQFRPFFTACQPSRCSSSSPLPTGEAAKPSARTRVFSGIQPTGSLHLGNYFGAVKLWTEIQGDPTRQLITSVVDMHAITLPWNPNILRANIRYFNASVDWLIEWMIIQCPNVRVWLDYWLIDRLLESFTLGDIQQCSIDWFVECFSQRCFHHLIDWLIKKYIQRCCESSIDWLMESLVSCLNSRLKGWIIWLCGVCVTISSINWFNEFFGEFSRIFLE